MAIVIIFKTIDREASELLLMERTVIGRSSKSDFVLDDNKISSIHCSIELNKEGQVLFKDLESTNGSYIENTKIGAHLLKIGECIRIGSTEISIDKQRLTRSELLSIGKSTRPSHQHNNDYTLPAAPAKVNTVSIVRVKKIERDVNAGKAGTVYEQESTNDNIDKLTLNSVKKKKN